MAVSPLSDAAPGYPVARQGQARTQRTVFRAWRASLPGGLERDTLLMPEVIAENVVREAERLTRTDLPAGFTERLAARAHQLYARNRRFKKTLNRPGNEGRDMLYVYLRHWTAGWLKRELPALSRQFPEGFALGHAVFRHAGDSKIDP